MVPNLWTTEFPGYEVRPGGNVAVGTVFGIRLTGPLLRFNPATNALDEMILPGLERLNVSDESNQDITTATGVHDGFNFFTHDGPGDHSHLFYTLYGNGQEPGGGADGARTSCRSNSLVPPTPPPTGISWSSVRTPTPT